MTDQAIAHAAPAQLEDARRVLRVLTAAFPTYPVGDDTAELYLAVICADMPDFATAMRVVTDWAQTQLLFPKPVELTESYLNEIGRAERRAKMARRGQAHARGDGTYACPRCQDVGFVVLTFTSLGHLYEGVAPCEVCSGSERDYWREGHYDLDHDVHACSHPRCDARASSTKRRRPGGGR